MLIGDGSSPRARARVTTDRRVVFTRLNRAEPDPRLLLPSRPHTRERRERSLVEDRRESSRSRRGIRCVLVIAGRSGRPWRPCEVTRSTTRYEKERDRELEMGRDQRDRETIGSATCLARLPPATRRNLRDFPSTCCRRRRRRARNLYDRYKRTNRTN